MANNIVTFYQGDAAAISMHGLVVAVNVDGRPAPWLELLEVTRCEGVRLNKARFRLVNHTLGLEGRFESVARVARPGQCIKATLTYVTDKASANQLDWPLFAGVVCEGSAQISGAGEEVGITACDEAAYDNDSKVVTDLRTLGPSGEVVTIKVAEVTFNPDGKGNCSAAVVESDGRSRHVFELSEAKACYWTYKTAIGYLASEYLATGTVDEAAYAVLETLTEGQALRDVEVTGLTPLAAIDRLCRRAGLRYAFKHAPQPNETVCETIHFYRQGQGREIFLRHQQGPAALDLKKTNMATCSVNSFKTGETVEVVGHGDVRRFESTFELAMGWDRSLEADDYERYSAITNDDFLEVRDVFRKWVLNEAGDYNGPPYNLEPYDFREVFGTSNYGRRRRRFWPCLSRDDSGESLGYYVEVSYDDGDTWLPYGGAFNNLLDECGIYISTSQLDVHTWVAIKKDMLRFRITAAVDSDEHLEAAIANGPINAARPVRRVFFDLGNEFKHRQVTAGSIFYDYSANGLGQPDIADDSAELRGYLRDQLRRVSQSQWSGTAVLPWVHPDIWPGDVVTEVSGRELDFNSRPGIPEQQPQVKSVKIELGGRWSTTIHFGED